MSNTITIARRELSGFFHSAIAYVVMCVFILIAGVLFLGVVFDSGAPVKEASLRQLFAWLVWVLVAIVPAISMRLLTEELRSGTIEPLMTSPVGDVEVILGKWLGGVTFFAVLLSPTLVFVIMLMVWGDPDPGPMFTGYVGLLLVGALFLAMGTLASVVTQNQIIAYVVTVFAILMLTLGPQLATRAIDRLGDQPVLTGATAIYIGVGVGVCVSALAGVLAYTITRSTSVGIVAGILTAAAAAGVLVVLGAIRPVGWAKTVAYINIAKQYDDFGKGLLTSRNFVYFISSIALFLTLAVKALESRKWR